MDAIKNNTSKRIAIACQGGGSHTAFTAGVLKRLLREEEKKFEITALSGTSGGAICALLAWYGLLMKDKEKAISLLDNFWKDNSANSVWDMMVNTWFVWTTRMQDAVSIPEVSPYSYPPLAHDTLRRLLNNHVEFGEIDTLREPASPKLFIGAVNVLSGGFKVFKSSGKKNEISVDAVLASCAIPTFLRAVCIENKVYWDGLFSQNPPIKEFIKGYQADEKPDEIWVIQINPKKRDTLPKSIKDILDRRNELSGNLSLNQEIDFINTVNKWTKYLPPEKYKPVQVNKIEMLNEDLDTASKLDRSPTFIRDMMAYGEKQADTFLADWSD